MANRSTIAERAYREKNPDLAKKAHTQRLIEHSVYHPDEHRGSGTYLGDSVYGALDGMVTTFAVVAGVAGANLAPSIILIMGFANLFADGFSMAASNYLSKKSEQDYHAQERAREQWEVENFPKGEVEEIRQIYKKKGFTGNDLERAVVIITSDKKRWVETMMVEELGLLPHQGSALTAAMVTFFSFLLWGFLPLLTYVLISFFPALSERAFTISCILTALGIFTAGSLRSRFIAKSWWRAGLEMLVVGGAAAGVAYLVGYFLRGVAQ